MCEEWFTDLTLCKRLIPHSLTMLTDANASKSCPSLLEIKIYPPLRHVSLVLKDLLQFPIEYLYLECWKLGRSYIQAWSLRNLLIVKKSLSQGS